MEGKIDNDENFATIIDYDLLATRFGMSVKSILLFDGLFLLTENSFINSLISATKSTI